MLSCTKLKVNYFSFFIIDNIHFPLFSLGCETAMSFRQLRFRWQWGDFWERIPVCYCRLYQNGPEDVVWTLRYEWWVCKSNPQIDGGERDTNQFFSSPELKHPWVKGIQVCSNEGPRPFSREIIKKLEKYFDKFKNFFSRTAGPISTKLGKINFGWREFKFVQLKASTLFQWEILTKLQKYIDKF